MFSLNYELDGQKVKKNLFSNFEYLINLWYPIKALKLGSNILKAYNKSKEPKVIDDKLDAILIVSFSELKKNFETK